MSSKFPPIVVDESTDARITQALRKAGYKIFSIQEEMPGTEDLEIIKFASINKSFILTEDKDFGDELIYRQQSHYGAMLLRLHGMDIKEKSTLILNVLTKNSTDLIGAFSVLSKNKLRIRRS